MKQKLNTLLLSALALVGLSFQQPKEKANYQIIPLPQEVNLQENVPFVLNAKTRIIFPQGNVKMERNAKFLASYIQQSTQQSLKIQGAKKMEANYKNAIVLSLQGKQENEEAYALEVSPQIIRIDGNTEAGVFYGIQTLRKSIPVTTQGVEVELPAVKINDAPRFAYRGMMLDVARHFFSVDFVKEYIDIIALHNINTFHWHLSDDQGWRVEIKKYPKLTEVGSIRKKTLIGRNGPDFNETPYGGFYTQEQIKEVVAYAAERYINVIPEIDLPGHMLAALTAYPELGCTGGPYEVCPRWGVFPDVLCPGNDQTLVFIKDVLEEITNLFPSKYIHIGGDESPRDRWKVCPKCQAKIKELGLKSDEHHSAEDRLQSYCTAQAEKFLNSKGRILIGWDEILEGDIAPNAVVMSWRGMSGGIKAAQMGHNVIMSPTTHAYFDYMQSTDTAKEPLGIGGFLPVEKVYSLEPAPDELTPEQKKHIIGAQANLWTEYIESGEHVEYMVLPRMAALCEAQWCQVEKKNYKDFCNRLPRLLSLYQRLGLKYATHIYDITPIFESSVEKKGVEITLSTIDQAPIHYTLDGSEPTAQSPIYKAPLLITKTTHFQAVAIRPNGKSRLVEQKISFNKATLKPIELKTTPWDKFTYKGGSLLVDGMRGVDNYSSGQWIGFTQHAATFVIDLQKEEQISEVSTEAIVHMAAWVMGFTEIHVAVSTDNKEFKEVAKQIFPAQTDLNKSGIESYAVSFAPTTTRYVQITVVGTPELPKGHPAEGKQPGMFIDEIAIN